jgi:urease accessory protein
MLREGGGKAQTREPGDLSTTPTVTTPSGGRRMGDVMTLRLFCRTALVAALSLFTTSAFAHHVMGGKTPSTFFEGLLSGIGHPVIGPDHLAFLLAIGIAVGVGGLNLALPALFVVASAIGVLLHVGGVNLPGAEIVVAASVLLAGFLIARGRAHSVGMWVVLFAVAGLFHGYAFGESIFGAETSPLDAYLLGLILIQSALTVGTALFVRWRGGGVSELAPRLAGAAIIGVGLTVLIGQLIPRA